MHDDEDQHRHSTMTDGSPVSNKHKIYASESRIMANDQEETSTFDVRKLINIETSRKK